MLIKEKPNSEREHQSFFDKIFDYVLLSIFSEIVLYIAQVGLEPAYTAQAGLKLISSECSFGASTPSCCQVPRLGVSVGLTLSRSSRSLHNLKTWPSAT